MRCVCVCVSMSERGPVFNLYPAGDRISKKHLAFKKSYKNIKSPKWARWFVHLDSAYRKHRYLCEFKATLVFYTVSSRPFKDVQ